MYLWGRFSLGSATLGRFLSLHFLLPLLVIGLLILHLILLHKYASSASLGFVRRSFYLSFLWKDIITIMILLSSCSFLVSFVPAQFMEADN